MVPLSSENRMIFWNTPTAAALRARKACAMNKCRLRAARGIVTDGRTPCPLSVLNSHLIAHPYDPQSTQPKQQSIRGKSRGSKKPPQHEQGKEPLARGKRLGGIHARQNDGGRKDWAAAVHHVLRRFYLDRLTRLSTTFA